MDCTKTVKGGMLVTYRRLAELAGVSPATVSKALSGSPEISRETAERIRMLAIENGVLKRRSNPDKIGFRIAIIVPEIVSVYYSSIVSDLRCELSALGINPAIYITNFDEECFVNIVDQLAEDFITDGIIVVSGFKYPRKLSIPLIYHDIPECDSSCDLVVSDIYSGIMAALEYLTELGHKRIGFVSEVHTPDKLDAFHIAAAKLGIGVRDSDIFVSDKRFEVIGYEAAAHFIGMQPRPTALICAYDEVALGMIHRFEALGVGVPEDISVIGINDIPAAAYSQPPLTTLATFSHEGVLLTVKLLLDRIKKPVGHMVQHVMTQCELIERETCALVKSNDN